MNGAPKLSAQQLVHIDGSFAERLDKGVERSERARVINGNGARVIEHSPVVDAKANGPIRRI
jgi:hypothetical protein